MQSTTQLADLLLRWQELQQQGQAVTLEELCAAAPELLPTLKRQIAALQSMAALVGATANESWATAPVGVASAAIPKLAPGYELLGELGRGGMGVVYKARQIGLKRVVALKMILAGGHGAPEQLARFRTEAEAVARLQHPHIVQIYEIGASDGLPFFSLEYVDGGSLDQKLAGVPQPVQDSARLVEQLARAMHAAHEKGIIHRDLKPPNVLLTKDGTPKITDFGLAKQLDEPGLTVAESVMGTPSYMAPEQAAGRITELGPLVDVYALGAILYEMLTGRPPFRAATVLDTLDQVRHQEPVPLTQLQPKTPRDLETICLKCLSKEPPKRYRSALALAEDLHRFQEGRPILARPIGRAERAWRWCRRNRATAASLTAAALVLLAGSAVSTWQAVRATREKNDKETALEGAQKRLEQVEKGIDVLALLLHDINPRHEEKGGPPLYELLAERASKAATELDAEKIGDPLTVARLQTVLGNTLQALGDAPKAIALLEKARATRTRELGATHRDTLVTMHNLAIAYQADGKFPEAIALYKQVHDVQLQTFEADDADTLRSQSNLALVYHATGRHAEAIDLFEQVRDAQTRKLGVDHPDTLITLNGLALSLRARGKLQEAMTLLEHARDCQLKSLGADHTDTLTTLTNLGGIYGELGRVRQAIAIFEQVRDAQLRKLGAEHIATLTTLSNLAWAHQGTEEWPEAIRLLEQVRNAQLRRGQQTHPLTLNVQHNLGMAYHNAGRLQDAIALYEQVREARRQKLGPTHSATLTTMNNLAGAYESAGRLPDAIALYEQVRQAQLQKIGADHQHTIITTNNLALAYQTVGQLSEAIPLFEQAAQALEKRQFMHPFAGRIIPNAIRAFEAAEQWPQAEAWQRKWLAVVKQKDGAESLAYAGQLASLGDQLLHQKKWPDAEATLRACLAIRAQKQPEVWTTFNAMSMLGEALLGLQRHADAEARLQKGYEGLKACAAKLPPGSPCIFEAQERLVRFYDETGNSDQAAKWRQELSTARAARLRQAVEHRALWPVLWGWPRF